MGSWLIHLLQNHGLIIVFLAMTGENACLPIPSEIVVPYGGVLAAQGHTTLWAVIVVSTAAALVGAAPQSPSVTPAAAGSLVAARTVPAGSLFQAGRPAQAE